MHVHTFQFCLTIDLTIPSTKKLQVRVLVYQLANSDIMCKLL